VIGAAMFTLVPQNYESRSDVKILAFSSMIILIMMLAPGGLHQIGVTLTRSIGEEERCDYTR